MKSVRPHIRKNKNLETLNSKEIKGFISKETDGESISFSMFGEETYEEKEGLLVSLFAMDNSNYGPLEMVPYGADNAVPMRILALYKKSGKHSSIINKKAAFVVGKGFQGRKDLSQILKACAIDSELVNYFFLEIIRNRLGQISKINHIPFQYVRTNKFNNIFYIGRYDLLESYRLTLPLFDPNDNKQERSVYMWKGFDAEHNVYPMPRYMASINYLIADAALGDHIKTQTSEGFAATRVIHFLDQGPKDKAAKDTIERKFNEKFQGPKGKKVIFTWSRNPEVKPVIEDLGTSDLTKEDYTNLNNIIRENIFIAHEVISPILFGISTAGSLGSKNEMMEAYEVYRMTYIDSIRTELENAFNYIDSSIGSIIDQYDVEQVNNNFHFASSNHISCCNSSGVFQNYHSAGKSYEETIKLFSQYGKPKSEYYTLQKFESIYDKYKWEIVQQLKLDSATTVEELQQLIRVDKAEIEKYLNELREAGYIDKNNVVLKPFRTPVWNRGTSVVQSVYSYELRAEIIGEPELLPTSRQFCKDLIKLDRYYSRKDIESLSVALGYDVFERAGGWWGKNPHCRHEWRRSTVIKNLQ